MTDESETPTKDPATARGRRTRLALIEAARAVFERIGFVDARVGDIVAEARVAHGTFYIYFRSKEDVLHAVIEELMERVDAAAREYRDTHVHSPYASIEAMNRSYLSVYRDNSDLMLVWEQVAGLDPTMGALHDRQVTWYTDRTERSILRLQADGLVDAQLDATYASEALCGMVFGFCTQQARRGEGFDLDRAVQTLTALWVGGLGLEVPAAEV